MIAPETLENIIEDFKDKILDIIRKVTKNNFQNCQTY